MTADSTAVLSVTRVFGDGCVMKLNVSDPVSVLFDAPPSRTVTDRGTRGERLAFRIRIRLFSGFPQIILR